jgi:hypothetical protein
MIQESAAAIEARLIAALQANPVLYDPSNIDPTKRGLTSPSQVAAWLNFLNLFATELYSLEQVMGIFETDVESFMTGQAVGTNSWLQDQISKFQWDATTPQIIQLIDFAPAYPIVNPALRLITQRAVVNNPTGGYTVKIASNLAPISTPQLNAFTSFLNQINFGVPYLVINAAADFLMLGADIYYDGQYSAVIIANVTAAINAYIQDFDTNNFNGDIFLTKLEDIIQAVPGVTDVVLKQVEARPAAVAAINATKLVNLSQVFLREYSTYAGYIIIDTDSGRTLADTLNFIVN